MGRKQTKKGGITMSLQDFHRAVSDDQIEYEDDVQEEIPQSLLDASHIDLDAIDMNEQLRILEQLRQQAVPSTSSSNSTGTSEESTTANVDILAKALQEHEDLRLAIKLSLEHDRTEDAMVKSAKAGKYQKVVVDYGVPQRPSIHYDDYDDFGDDFDPDDDEEEVNEEGGVSTKQDSSSGSATLSDKITQPVSNKLMKFSGRINLGGIKEFKEQLPSGLQLSNTVKNTIKQHEMKDLNSRIRFVDKENRATVEQVLDPRTRMILFKMINNGTLYSIDGCISTGKEANVYYATPGEEADPAMRESGDGFAIKVYKTSILVFKDRDRYVTGEYRFKSGYSKHNPRKMVRVWAEKEMRNLKRLEAIGVACPSPILLKQHVLVMQFIGKNGWPAPRLKDVDLKDSKLREIYLDIIKTMRRIYQEAKLVHGDLSEYNMLYFKGKVYFIDVSQSVEHDHPNALEFLRKDCANIRDFFIKKGLTSSMTTRELFEYITDITINAQNEEAYLEKMMEIISNRPIDMSAQEQVDAAVFQQVFIPRTLTEVVDYEQQLDKEASTDTIFYRTVTGLNMSLTGANQKPDILQAEDESSDDDDDDESVDETDEEDDEEAQEGDAELGEEGEEDDEEEKKPGLPDLSKMPKKERKAFVKELKRQKRENKIPKHVKKRYRKVNKDKKR
jgi:RIO kinase 1